MATFRTLAPTTRTALLADLEGLWQRVDELLARLGPDEWSGRHGQHWTFPDVPYHLAYFDLDVIATAIRRGLNIPLREQVLRSETEQDASNEIKFTQRPADTTPQQCLEQMRSSRQAIRDAIVGLSEADLERPVFLPLVGLGWVSVGEVLETCYSHTWNHFLQLRLWMKCTTPALSPEQNQRALSYLMTSFAKNIDRTKATQTRLTVVMEFSGSGGGTWTLHVGGGTCRVSIGRPACADLVITQSSETFVKTRTGIQKPFLARLSGKLRVRGWRKLGTFGKLFPIQSLDFAPARAFDLRMLTHTDLLMQASAA